MAEVVHSTAATLPQGTIAHILRLSLKGLQPGPLRPDPEYPDIWIDPDEFNQRDEVFNFSGFCRSWSAEDDVRGSQGARGQAGATRAGEDEWKGNSGVERRCCADLQPTRVGSRATMRRLLQGVLDVGSRMS